MSNLQIEELCTRDDLEAIVTCWDRWTVDENGYATEITQCGASNPEDLEDYVCNNCDEHFTPNEAYDAKALQLAWQRALEHLKQGEGM